MPRTVSLPAAVEAVLAALAALLLIGVMAVIASLVLRAAERAESDSRGDLPSRQRALDELVGLGSLKPEEYGDRQEALLREH
jgi:cobalamin biosynthesis protein CobD/CbiB